MDSEYSQESSLMITILIRDSVTRTGHARSSFEGYQVAILTI